MNDPQGPELVPSTLKIGLLVAAVILMAAGVRTVFGGSPLLGGLTAYAGVLVVFGCYAHGNGERNRVRAMQRRNGQS